MRKLSIQFALAWIVALGAVQALAADEAKALFDRYVKLEHAFDPAAADIYADMDVTRNA